jgi:hypothetical protein
MRLKMQRYSNHWLRMSKLVVRYFRQRQGFGGQALFAKLPLNKGGKPKLPLNKGG